MLTSEKMYSNPNFNFKGTKLNIKILERTQTYEARPNVVFCG